MNSIISVHDLNSLNPDTLVLVDDEMDGICLGMKSDKVFNNIDFKFKKLKFNNIFFGIILLKLDNTFSCCYIALNEQKDKKILEKLLYSDYFNFIVFNGSDYNKIYRISNTFENKLLMSIPNMINKQMMVDTRKMINELKHLYSPEFLWNK